MEEVGCFGFFSVQNGEIEFCEGGGRARLEGEIANGEREDS